MATFEVRVDDTTATVAVFGDLTAAAVPSLRDGLRSTLAEGVRTVHFDFNGVVVIDSSGIGLLVATHNSVTRAGGSIDVVGASDDVVGLFRAMRLDHHFAVAGR